MEKFISVLKNAAVTLLLIAATTLIGAVIRHWDFHLTNIVILYIFAVLLTARFTRGYIYGIIATAMSFFLFNWFFTEPLYSLKIDDPTYIITIIIMTITATMTSALTSKVKQSADEAREKEEETNAVFTMTNYLTDALDNEKIASVSVETISRALSCNAAFICCDENGHLCSTFIQQKPNGQQIHRKLEHPEEFQKKLENLHTPYSVGNEFCDFPIFGRTMMLGVLCIPREIGEHLNRSQMRLVHSLVESASLALDRTRSLQEQTKSREETIQERYRGNLLRAISHDLRTPLSGIMGTSEMLMGMTEKDDPRYGMAKDIYEDAEWLHGLVENILNLTKFQDGHIDLKKESEAVEEVIGAALFIVDKRMKGREISVDVPENVLFVPMDANLITQVIVNLLDNAAKYTPEKSEISIKVEEDREFGIARFTVADNGNGIPEHALPSLFKMFYTVGHQESAAKKGVGLGLSICQSIVEAHGGTILARNREGGGAEFIFTLPLEEKTK